jgi:hypothetical protein
MKQTVIIIQNPRAALGARIPAAPQPRRAAGENFPVASGASDDSKNPKPAKIKYEGGYRWIKVDKA